MARVFLINPPSPEPVKTPLLSFCHLAASLRAGGHEVALLDASAPFAPRSHDEIEARVAAFAPDVVGLHLKTLHVQPAYALAARLAPRFRLCAGGPHPTVCADEPFRHGFTWSVRGEGEETLVELADAVDGERDFAGVASLGWLDRGMLRQNAARSFLRELDALASPMSALDLFDPAWYGAARALPPAGLLSSRGCPAACTFCSNNVTGRKFRYRSPESVAAEVRHLRERFGLTAFSFFDDSFAVGQRRVDELCEALRACGPVHWTCTAHPAHLDRETLARMKRAGCGGVDIGMESADAGMLERIGKGVTVERVLDVLGWCRELGLHTVVNLMFGWPDESDAELDATIGFMERAAPLAGGFNARGVVVPYPGTEIYDRHHERFGFSEWWIREPALAYPAFPTAWSAAEVMRCYAADPALERNFFRHPPHRVRRIADALALKAELTLGTIARQAEAHLVPAAGAR
ncbi:MAG TPA: radical SAM protein [Polyangia bacterium]|nr:radical SAM protein [Polyangia bacterium]